jgi:hypothetical protein
VSCQTDIDECNLSIRTLLELARCGWMDGCARVMTVVGKEDKNYRSLFKTGISGGNRVD